MTTEDRIDTALHQAAEDSRDDQGHRGIWVGGVVLLAGLLILAIAVSAGYRMITDLGARADSNAAVAQQLADQIRSAGGTPVVQPPVPGERGPVGPQGEPGTDGVDGRPGTNGVDGTTPPCLAEPSQCRGADGTGVPGPQGEPGSPGEPGLDGAPGQNGENGVDGRPPAGWTWVDGEGRTQSCTRDAGSPDSVPTYTCTAPSDGPPGTTTEPLLPPLGR